EGDDDALARAQERPELALGLGEAAGSDRGRCASKAKGWDCGNGSSSVEPASEGGSWTPSSSQTRRTSSGWKTRSGGRSSGGTRSSGTAGTTGSSSSSASNRLLPSSTVSVRRSAAGYSAASATGWSAR